MSRPYELLVSGPAARTISEDLPEAVAAAVIELITGALLENPQRVGRELRNELTGIWSARRGAFRVLCEFDESLQQVHVIRIDHRRDVYRSIG